MSFFGRQKFSPSGGKWPDLCDERYADHIQRNFLRRKHPQNSNDLTEVETVFQTPLFLALIPPECGLDCFRGVMAAHQKKTSQLNFNSFAMSFTMRLQQVEFSAHRQFIPGSSIVQVSRLAQAGNITPAASPRNQEPIPKLSGHALTSSWDRF